MCWSAEVAGTFSALQFGVFVYLFIRNKHYDRWYCLSLAPVMTQEFCQMMLWLNVGESLYSCNDSNKAWSIAAAMCWRFVTSGFYLTAFSKLYNERWRKIVFFIVTCLAVSGYVADIVNRIWGIEHYCSYPGLCGHLLWGPDTDTSIFDPWVQVVYYLTYLGPLPVLAFLGKFDDLRSLPCCKDSTKGYWSGLGIVVIGVGTWAPTFLYFNVVAKDRCDAAEWSSMRLYTLLVDPAWTPAASSAEYDEDRQGPARVPPLEVEEPLALLRARAARLPRTKGSFPDLGAELAQARATVVEHRKVSDLMQMWEERIHKQAQHFDAFAEQVLRFDCDLIANAAKVKVLREEHGQLKGRQELVDRSLQQIWDQQDSLGRLLSGMLEALRPQQQQQADEAAGNAAAPARSHQRALQLTLQLDELERQAEDLARETGKVQSNLYKEPLTTVVRVLDAHAGALDAISTQVTSVNQRLQDIERTM
ncbi:unnamed protein product [Effrenium voratum]|uniref:Nucleoporin NSP1-like C-terminal domain-containing protein n=1 Tax=Effrenium voratum TaxID=2562239 RepID=A0AA36J0B2_9DINO|nr:unnamed protein product [Effrenium voratum]